MKALSKQLPRPAAPAYAAGPRTEILHSARSLFAEKGFEGASTQEIADRAGVNKRLVFYYFNNKEELYLAALEDFFGKVEKFLDNFCVTPDDLDDPWLSLIRFSDNFIYFASRYEEPIRILMREIMNRGKLLPLLTERYIKPIFTAGENYLGNLVGARSGNGREVQHLLLSFGGANLLYFMVAPLLERLWEVDPTSKEALEERKRELRRFIVRTL
ncbi:MAG TPA: helix-turn-helix domain-containing protein [bacterium]|nr:helix-turn-helix domain-containing protein [bacterium]